MASSSLRTSLLKHSVENLSIKGARCYHPELEKFPNVPLPIHDSEYQLFPESGQPFNLLVPDLSEFNYHDIKNEAIIRFNDSVIQGQRIIKWTSEINFISNSNQAIQTARHIPNKILKNNYFISNEGTIIVEKILQLEKLMASAKEKLSEITNKLPDTKEIAPQVIRVWENVKQKLPSWQKSIANKMHAFQNRLNKKISPTNKEE